MQRLRTFLVLSGLAALLLVAGLSAAARADDCRYTAAVSVTAGNTTEIVALTTSQRIRICNIAVSLSATGTMKFVTGTGTNCGTGTADLTSAMTLATGTPLTSNASPGQYLVEAPVSQAVCITSATGNTVGWINYDKK